MVLMRRVRRVNLFLGWVCDAASVWVGRARRTAHASVAREGDFQRRRTIMEIQIYRIHCVLLMIFGAVLIHGSLVAVNTSWLTSVLLPACGIGAIAGGGLGFVGILRDYPGKKSPTDKS
jgi:hypothetical protein